MTQQVKWFIKYEVSAFVKLLLVTQITALAIVLATAYITSTL